MSSSVAITLFKTPCPLWRREKFCLVMCPPDTLENFFLGMKLGLSPKSSRGEGQYEALDKFPRA